MRKGEKKESAWVVAENQRGTFRAPNYSERLKVTTLTFWKFKGRGLCFSGFRFSNVNFASCLATVGQLKVYSAHSLFVLALRLGV